MVKNLLKKVCLVVSVLLGLGSNVQAQETSVTFDVSDDGKTLTISGQGDLTTYQAVSDELKFTPDAYGKVSYNNNQQVSATTVYDDKVTYSAKYPKEITALYPDYVSADATYSWNEDKIGGLFYTTDWGNTWKVVQSSDKVDLEIWYDGKGYSKYSTKADKSGRILMEDFKKGNYPNSG